MIAEGIAGSPGLKVIWKIRMSFHTHGENI